MIENKSIIMYDMKEFLHEIFKQGSRQRSNLKYLHIPIIKDNSDFQIIKKKLHLKRWKETINYYYLPPEKFRS